MITKEEIEQIRKVLNMPEQHGSYEKHHNRAEQILDRLDKLVSSSNVIHDVSDSFQFTHEEIEGMTNRELIIYCEYLKLKQYPLFWRYVDEVKVEK